MYSTLTYLFENNNRNFKEIHLLWIFRGNCLFNEWKYQFKYINQRDNRFHFHFHCTRGYNSFSVSLLYI